MLALALSLALAEPGFLSEPVEHVQGTAEYGYGIVVEDADTPDVWVTASVLPEWMTLEHERAWTTTTLTGGQGIRGFADGDADTARFKNMYGITIGLDGDLYLADTHNHAIRRVDAITGAVTTVAGNGELGFVDAPGVDARFWFPQGIATHPDGTLLVADAFNHVIRGVDPTTGDVWTVAGVPGERGRNDGTDGRLYQPKGVAVSPGGDVYIADSGNHSIRTLNGASLETLAGSLQGFAGHYDDNGTSARFSSPRGMTVGPDGHLYIADKDNNRIRRMTTDTLDVTTVVGSGIADNVDATALRARLWHPFDVSADAEGNLYFPDSSNHTVRRYDALTEQVETLAGDGSAGFSNGLEQHARLYFPRSVAVDPDGQIYVADRSNASVRVLLPTQAQLIGHATSQEAGVHPVTLVADSDTATQTQSFSVTVTRINQRPRIWGTPQPSVAEGQPFSFTPSAQDADGDDLSYTVAMLPHWASFDPQTGTVSGTPGFEDAGRYVHVAITVDDGQDTDNSTDTLAPFMLDVTDTNRAPELSGTPTTRVEEESEWVFAPVGSDLDADNTLTYAVENAPEWASFDPETGELWGTPAWGDAGTTANIIVSVTDNSGADNATTSLPAFDLDVTVRNLPPTVAVALEPVDANQGQTTEWMVPEGTFEDPNDDVLVVTLSDLPPWTTFDGTTLSLRPTATDVGTTDVTVTATDPDGQTAEATLVVTIIDTIAPVLTLTAPNTADGPFNVTLTTTEQLTDLRMDDIWVTRGSPNRLLLNDDGTYTLTVTPDESGDVTIGMDAGVAHDDAGNPNDAVDPATVVWLQPVDPDTTSCSAVDVTGLSWGLLALGAGLIRRRQYVRPSDDGASRAKPPEPPGQA